MHTPDGFITSWICILMLLVSAIAILFSIKNIKFNKNKLIRMALLGAIIFAAQMLNFPIAEGTSGHLIGAALVAILLGPYEAILIISSVLFLQGIVFGDGGMFSIGVNILNMAIVASFSAHYLYKKFNSVLLSSWASVFLASFSAASLLFLSGISFVVFPAMLFTHSIIGIGEALITLALFYYFTKAKNILPITNIAVYSTAFACLLLALVLPFVSESPDGLESVAINLGFYSNAIELYSAPIPDYLFMGSVLFAGIIGTLLTFVFIYSIGSIKPVSN